MNVVDSSAWLSYFAGDGNADIFSRPISLTDRLIVPSITLTEVFKSVLRQRGEDLALVAIAHMQQGKVIPLDAALAIEAAKFGIEEKLPLADSIIYATAQRYSALLWTQDEDLDSLQGVRFYTKKST